MWMFACGDLDFLSKNGESGVVYTAACAISTTRPRLARLAVKVVTENSVPAIVIFFSSSGQRFDYHALPQPPPLFHLQPCNKYRTETGGLELDGYYDE